VSAVIACMDLKQQLADATPICFLCRVARGSRQPLTSRLATHPSNTHTHTFNGPFSGTTQVSRYQKGRTNLDFTEARDSEWQWHQLDHMQVCTLLQTDNHTSTPLLSFFAGRMPFLPPNQQCQSTEGTNTPWQRPAYSLVAFPLISGDL